MAARISIYDENAAPERSPLEAPVPENLVGAPSTKQLQLIEDVGASFRTWQLAVGRAYVPGQFDAEHFRDLHAHVVQDIYPAIGGTRNDELNLAKATNQSEKAEDLSKFDARVSKDNETIMLLAPGKVNKRLDDLAGLLKEENYLMGLEKPQFVTRMAEYYTQYAQAAPFTSGNKHVLGAAFMQLGQEAGYNVDLTKAPELSRVTDALLVAGVKSDKTQLLHVLSSVTEEAAGPEAELRRKATMQVLRPDIPERLIKSQHEEDISQAGTRIVGRVGGEQGQAFRASMRAITAGNSEPEDLNIVRTTARGLSGEPGLKNDIQRIEVATGALETIRRQEQALGRQLDSQQVRPGQEVGTRTAEITR